MTGFVRDPLARRARSLAFNGDSSYFSVATDEGFEIFTTESCEAYLDLDLGLVDDAAIEGGTAVAMMLGSSQIVGIVDHAEPYKLSLCDSELRKKTAHISLSKSAIIVSCRLSITHIIICTDRKLYLYRHTHNAITKIAVYDTALNPAGICALGNRVCAFPGRSEGQIQLVRLPERTKEGEETGTLSVSIVAAHESSLRALCLSPDEGIVASASVTGTLIRLHTTQGPSARLLELRRGVSPAHIYSITISPDSSRLAVTSDTNSLHVFNVPPWNYTSGQSKHSESEDGWQKVDSNTPSSGLLNIQKWGGLAKLPFAPRIFSDTYSFATVAFDPGSDQSASPKGVAAWVDDHTIAVLSAGWDARYERFRLAGNDAGGVNFSRAGWCRFMRPN